MSVHTPKALVCIRQMHFCDDAYSPPDVSTDFSVYSPQLRVAAQVLRNYRAHLAGCLADC